MNGKKLASAAALALGVILFTGGCDRLTRAHFDMIEVGFAERYDVEKTIGDPDHELSDQWLYERVDKHLNVMIHFGENERVSRKEWHDVENGIHYDSSPAGGDSSTYEGTEIRTINQ